MITLPFYGRGCGGGWRFEGGCGALLCGCCVAMMKTDSGRLYDLLSAIKLIFDTVVARSQSVAQTSPTVEWKGSSIAATVAIQ